MWRLTRRGRRWSWKVGRVREDSALRTEINQKNEIGVIDKIRRVRRRLGVYIVCLTRIIYNIKMMLVDVNIITIIIIVRWFSVGYTA